MRTFKEITKELELKKFLFSENGTLYFPTDDDKLILVRHFDQEIPKEMSTLYANVTKALDDFVKSNEALNSLVNVQQPIEVGTDFVAITHHVYYISIDSYYDEDEECEIPSQFDLLKTIFTNLKKQKYQKSERILLRILENSFVLPTSKTYFNSIANKFINVDPKMDIDALKEWQAAVEVDC